LGDQGVDVRIMDNIKMDLQKVGCELAQDRDI